MTLGTAFGTQGATPTFGVNLGTQSLKTKTQTSTPSYAPKASSNITSGLFPKEFGSGDTNSSSTPGSNPGILHNSPTSSPTSVTTTSTDPTGKTSTVKSTYDNSTTGDNSSSGTTSQTTGTNTGMITQPSGIQVNPNNITAGTSPIGPTPPAPQTTGGTTTTNGQPNNTAPTSPDYSGYGPFGQALNTYQGYANEASNYAQGVNNAMTIAGIGTTMAQAQGRGALIQQTQGNELAGLESRASNALTTAGLIKPDAGATFYGSALTGGLVGGNSTSTSGDTTGTNYPGVQYTGNSVIDTSLNNALGIIAAGGSTSDAEAALGGGQVGMNAFTQAMEQFDSNWSPTSSNAIAAGNMQIRQKYLNQGADISAGLSRLDGIGSQVSWLLGNTGAQPFSTPIGNSTFSNYFTNVNPSAEASIKAGLGEIENSVSSIISASTGLTPTAVSGIVSSYDTLLENLNPSQLNDFLNNIKQYGQVNLQTAQSGSNGQFGSNAPAANPGSLSTGTNNSPGVAGVSTGITLAQGLISKITNELGNIGAGAAGGAVEGALTGGITAGSTAAGAVVGAF